MRCHGRNDAIRGSARVLSWEFRESKCVHALTLKIVTLWSGLHNLAPVKIEISHIRDLGTFKILKIFRNEVLLAWLILFSYITKKPNLHSKQKSTIYARFKHVRQEN